MMITIPIVLYGVMRYQFLSEKGDSTGTPEDILFRDRPIQLTIAAWIAACAIVIYGDPHPWLANISSALDALQTRQ